MFSIKFYLRGDFPGKKKSAGSSNYNRYSHMHCIVHLVIGQKFGMVFVKTAIHSPVCLCNGSCSLWSTVIYTHYQRTRFYQLPILYWCNSVETAQPGDRTTNPDIVMPECYASSQRVDSLARVVITPVRHTHTRLHTPLSNICSSPSSIQHTRGLNSSISLHTSCIFYCNRVGYKPRISY